MFYIISLNNHDKRRRITLHTSTGVVTFFSNPAFILKLPIRRLIDVILAVIGGGGGAYGGGTEIKNIKQVEISYIGYLYKKLSSRNEYWGKYYL